MRDNGPGIEPETLARIFSPFYTSKTSGTGLGLAISKKLVDAHGGSIEVQSTPGQGTEFLLTFPKHAVCGPRSRPMKAHKMHGCGPPGRRRRAPERPARPETPEQRAEAKMAAAGEAIRWSVITIALLIFVPPVGLVVLFLGGARHLRNLYRLVIEPKLRQRFIDREVSRQVSATLSDERQQMVGEHARSMETLSASIAHEIRNPITAAKSLVQQMEEDPTAAENVEYARVALEELDRVERSVSHLLRFAREEEMGVGDVQLAEVIDSALETFRERIARAGIELVRRAGRRGRAARRRREAAARGHQPGRQRDRRAGREPHARSPRIELAMGENLAGTEVWVRVHDNGPGIDREALQKIFSPFYTSKANGTGLGLAISKKLVDAHDGTLDVGSQPGAGAEFLVTLPKQHAGRRAAREGPHPDRRGRARDPARALRAAAARGLRGRGRQLGRGGARAARGGALRPRAHRSRARARRLRDGRAARARGSCAPRPWW